MKMTQIAKKQAIDSKAKALLELDEDAALYATINEKIENLTVQKGMLREKLLTTVTSIGNRDDKGNLCVATSRFKVVRQQRKSSSLNEDAARKMFEAKGLLKQVIVTVEQFDEDAITRLVEQGTVTPDELGAVTDVRESTALTVKELK